MSALRGRLELDGRVTLHGRKKTLLLTRIHRVETAEHPPNVRALRTWMAISAVAGLGAAVPGMWTQGILNWGLAIPAAALAGVFLFAPRAWRKQTNLWVLVEGDTEAGTEVWWFLVEGMPVVSRQRTQRLAEQLETLP